MSTEVLEIVTYPNPILTQACEDIDPRDPSVKDLARKMAATMYASNGVGLAAPQVGVNKRIIVVDCDQENGSQQPIVLLNPKIIKASGEEVVDEEGCLSVPGISVPVRRPEYVVVEYTDLAGQDWIIEGDGLLGRCLQHEIDHLDGITLMESCDINDKLKAVQDYAKAQAAGAMPGSTSI